MAALSWLADCESSSLPSDASSLHGCEHCWHTKLTLRGQFPGVGVRFAGCRGGGSAGGSNREAPRSCESNVTNMRRDHRPENSVGRSHEKCTGARGGGGAQTCVLQRAFLRCLRVSGGAETPRGRCARWEGLPFRVEPGLTPDPILGGRERGRRREKGGGGLSVDINASDKARLAIGGLRQVPLWLVAAGHKKVCHRDRAELALTL